MNTRYFYLLRFALAGCDLLLLNGCLFLGIYFSEIYGFPIFEKIYTGNILLCNIWWLFCGNIFNLYSVSSLQKLEVIKNVTIKTFSFHSAGFLLYLIFDNQYSFPYFFFGLYISLMVLGLVCTRFIGKDFLTLLRKKIDCRKAVAILNINQRGASLASYLRKQRTLNFMGFLNIGRINKIGKNLKSNLAAQFKKASDSGIQEVYVLVDPNQVKDYSYLVEESDKQCLRLKFVPDLSAYEDNFNIDSMGDFKVLSPRKEPLESISNRFLKRSFDIAVSFMVIVFILSWLFPLLAIIIKLQSKGPVVFKQLRNGRDNKTFWCYKFRSMYTTQINHKDKRSLVTPIGKFMRKTSLDEFPQFFNVFLGDMTIIGPRPHMLSDTEAYRKLIDNYMVRHFLKPGISGWAQVNGYRGQTMTTEQMAKRVEYDIWYMENWNLLLDVKIMLLTVKNIFKGEENAF